MEMNEPIKSIFKYYSINQNLYNSIINNELFFSNPRIFNDPFDSNPRFKLCSDEEKLLIFFLNIQLEINKQSDKINSITYFEKRQTSFKFLIDTHINLMDSVGNFYDLDKDKFEDRLIEIFTFYNNLEYFKQFVKLNHIELQKKMFNDFIFLTIDIKKYGIWCGSMTATCPVMWGHYANNHKGVCLEYELFDSENNHYINYPKDTPFKLIGLNYTNQPLDIFSLSADDLIKLTDVIINTKYEKWDYEKEVRLIHKDQGLVKFNSKSLKRIIFGYRTTPRERYALCKLLGSLRYQSNLFIAKVQPDNYELKIEAMKMEDIAGSGVHIEELNLKHKQ
jgi:hypothetical protein